MVNTDNENIDNEKVLGGKRKNGHKMDCGCHICENMKAKAKRHGYKEDLQKEEEKRKGGPKKINGHKVECDCQICNNMKHSKSKSKGKKIIIKEHKTHFVKKRMDTKVTALVPSVII
jgi:hypothetical protein